MSAILRYCFPSLFPASEQQQQPTKTDKNHDKFVRLGFPEELCKSHPDCVDFLITSGVAFTIAMFRDSTGAGKDDHGVRMDWNGHPLLKMNGAWQRWDHINQVLEYDKRSRRLISKGQPDIGWNYISPEGFVQKDLYAYDAIYHVEELNLHEYQSLMTHAQKFWEKHPEVDQGQEKKCILQIVSTQNDLAPRNWFNENFLENNAEHSFVRVVDEKGQVYSFGDVMPPEESAVLKSNLPFTLLASVNANVGVPDYDESRPFDKRAVTSIPLTTERANNILEYFTQANKDGIRFGTSKQSCLKFPTVALDMAGVPVDTKITFGELLGSMVPDIRKLPVISQFFAVAAKVQELVQPIFDTIKKYTPEPIKKAISCVSDALNFVGRKIDTICTNTVALVLGGWKMSEPKPNRPHDPKPDEKRITYFHRLLDSFGDFFDDETATIYHSMRLKSWQKQQDSTIVYSYEGPKMYILPQVS
ncbi:MAG: hypothetical protein JSR46_07185 [Verrucomicrobia bacterium]|nr:hypothetical protein [Verrucomicrobiota bacterium]